MIDTCRRNLTTEEGGSVCNTAGEENVNNVRALVEDCCGWNRKTWADAIEFAVSQFPERLDAKKVLEIGAGTYSSVSPIFSSKGAERVCSYYGQRQEDVQNGQLQTVVQKYSLKKIPIIEQNIYNIEGKYDIIILKSVLGGICRYNDYAKISVIVDKLFVKNIREGGALLTLDNGHVNLFERARRLWGAGKNEWTYFTQDKLISSLSGYQVIIKGFGFLNVGAAKFLLQGNYEFINDIIYNIDKVLIRLVTSHDRAVLSTIIRKTPHRYACEPVS